MAQDCGWCGEQVDKASNHGQCALALLEQAREYEAAGREVLLEALKLIRAKPRTVTNKALL